MLTGQVLGTDPPDFGPIGETQSRNKRKKQRGQAVCFFAGNIPLRHQLDKNMFFALWLLHSLFLCVYLFLKGQMIGNHPVPRQLGVFSRNCGSDKCSNGVGVPTRIKGHSVRLAIGFVFFCGATATAAARAPGVAAAPAPACDDANLQCPPRRAPLPRDTRFLVPLPLSSTPSA